jgi:cell division protein ZapB
MEDDDLYQNAALAESGGPDDLPETAIVSLALLAERVDRLLRLHEDLERENQALRERNEALRLERDALHDRNEQSRARIEAMIVRLRDLEQTS